MATVEDLLVRIDASTETLRRELKRGDAEVARSSVKIDRSLARVDKSFERLGLSAKKALRSSRLGMLASVAGIALLARSMKRGTENAIAYADNIKKTADAAGLSTDALQELRFAADKAGVGTEAFDKAVKFLTKSVGELRTRISSELSTALKDYDSELLNAIKTAEDQEAVFLLVIRAIEKETDATKRAALAKAAFGRAGLDMVNIANGVAGALERDRKAARDTGAVLEGALLDGAVNAKDELTELEKQIEANTTRILLNLSPALVGATALFADLTAAISDAGEALGNSFTSGPEDQLTALKARLAALQAAAAVPDGQLFSSSAKGPKGRRGQSPVATPGAAGPSQRPGGGGGSEINILTRQIAALEKIVALKQEAAAPAATPGGDTGPDLVAGIIPVRKDLERAQEWTELLRGAAATIEETRTAAETYSARLAELDQQLAANQIGQVTYSRAVAQAEQAFDDASGATAKYNEMTAEAEGVIAATRTETERYQAEVARLTELRKAELISVETYNRALGQAKKRMAETSIEAEVLARGMDLIDQAIQGNMDTWQDWARVRGTCSAPSRRNSGVIRQHTHRNTGW